MSSSWYSELTEESNSWSSMDVSLNDMNDMNDMNDTNDKTDLISISDEEKQSNMNYNINGLILFPYFLININD